MANKRQTNAKKVTYNGVSFRSTIEKDMYKLLKESGIPFAYEERKFEIDEGFFSPNDSYEKFLNGRGKFINRGSKEYKASQYTPDFTPPKGEPLKWVIEVKGRAFSEFPRTWRLFKKLLVKEKLGTICFVPRNIKDCIETIKIIRTL